MIPYRVIKERNGRLRTEKKLAGFLIRVIKR